MTREQIRKQNELFQHLHNARNLQAKAISTLQSSLDRGLDSASLTRRKNTLEQAQHAIAVALAELAKVAQ